MEIFRYCSEFISLKETMESETGAEVIKLLCDLQREAGVTLIVVTHSPEVAGRMDRVVEMTPTGLLEK